jgi:vitamin B12 transporter
LRFNARVGEEAWVTVGATAERERERSTAEFRSGFGTFGSAVDESRVNHAYYAQGIARIAGRWTANAGARWDRNQRFGGFLTARAGLAHELPTGTRWSVAAGTGFKEPTFIENFGGGFVTGNADLAPERSVSWEIGLEQAFLGDRVRLSGTYFDQRFRDLIQYVASPPTPEAPNFYNLAAAEARGVEADLQIRTRIGLGVDLAYTYLRTTVSDAGAAVGLGEEFVEGRALLRRPAHAVSGAVRYQGGWATAVLEIQYTGRRDDLDFRAFPFERLTLPAHTVVNVGGEVELVRLRRGPTIRATGRLENVFDVHVEEVFNFRSPGRVLLLGARVYL